MNVRVIWVFDYFMCSIYRYDFLNFWIFCQYLFRSIDSVTTVPRYLMSGKNWLFKSGKTIRLQWDFCRSRISAGFGKSVGFRSEPKSGIALVCLCPVWVQERWWILGEFRGSSSPCPSPRASVELCRSFSVVSSLNDALLTSDDVRCCWRVVRFIIKDQETFFAPAQRCMIAHEILMRAKFDDESHTKFGWWCFANSCFIRFWEGNCSYERQIWNWYITGCNY